jgi:acetoin utilization deacetylase AcuC-like enzyme
MRVYYSDHQDFPLPQGHRFPKDKYPRLRQRLIRSGLLHPTDLRHAPPVRPDQLRLVHSEDYLQRALRGDLTPVQERRIGLPWSPELARRAQFSVGGTIAASRAAMSDGIAASLSGGTHHAHADFGAGFCTFNDIAVAARVLQAENPGLGIVVIDCDVHQGDGTAAIFSADPSVYTFSIHGENNFPYHKAHSDLDIPLPDATGDEAYLAALADGLQRTIEASQADLAIYLAGADPYVHDRLGRLSLTKQGLAQRDQLVLNSCCSAGIPVAIVMSGGYARHIEDVVDIHLQTLHTALDLESHYRTGDRE